MLTGIFRRNTAKIVLTVIFAIIAVILIIIAISYYKKVKIMKRREALGLEDKDDHYRNI